MNSWSETRNPLKRIERQPSYVFKEIKFSSELIPHHIGRFHP